MSKYRVDPEVQLRPDRTAASGWSVHRPASSDATYEIERRDVVDLLLYCESGRTTDEIESYVSERTGIPEHEAGALVSDLRSESVLVPDELSTEKARWFRYRWTQAFYYHLASRTVPSESELADRRSPVTIPDTRQRRPESESIALPVPDEPPASSLSSVLTGRRTCRSFDDEPVALDDLATMLFYATLPARETRHRMGDVVVSDDGTYSELASIPIHAYLVVFQPGELDCGVYEYDVDRHGLAHIETDLSRDEFRTLPGEMYANDDADGSGAAVLYSVDFRRYQRLFPYARALRTAYASVSRRAHRFLLVATAVGYQVFQSGALAHSDVNDLVAVDAFDESVVFMTAVGEGEVDPGLGGSA